MGDQNENEINFQNIQIHYQDSPKFVSLNEFNPRESFSENQFKPKKLFEDSIKKQTYFSQADDLSLKQLKSDDLSQIAEDNENLIEQLKEKQKMLDEIHHFHTDMKKAFENAEENVQYLMKKHQEELKQKDDFIQQLQTQYEECISELRGAKQQKQNYDDQYISFQNNLNKQQQQVFDLQQKLQKNQIKYQSIKTYLQFSKNPVMDDMKNFIREFSLSPQKQKDPKNTDHKSQNAQIISDIKKSFSINQESQILPQLIKQNQDFKNIQKFYNSLEKQIKKFFPNLEKEINVNNPEQLWKIIIVIFQDYQKLKQQDFNQEQQNQFNKIINYSKNTFKLDNVDKLIRKIDSLLEQEQKLIKIESMFNQKLSQ